MSFRSLIPFGRPGAFAPAEYDPFAAMRRDMDRLFDSFGHGFRAPALKDQAFLTPKVNIAETERGLELTAELPGIDQKDIHVDVADGILTLKAEHQEEKEEKDEKMQFHLVERSSGTYLRRFALPFAADEPGIEASFDKGVLHVTVPRAVAAGKTPKKIAVKGK